MAKRRKESMSEETLEKIRKKKAENMQLYRKNQTPQERKINNKYDRERKQEAKGKQTPEDEKQFLEFEAQIGNHESSPK